MKHKHRKCLTCCWRRQYGWRSPKGEYGREELCINKKAGVHVTTTEDYCEHYLNDYESAESNVPDRYIWDWINLNDIKVRVKDVEQENREGTVLP